MRKLFFQNRKNQPGSRRNQRGYVLVMMAGAGIALMGATGLAIDLGRMYINKQEAQSFADAAAIAAALELDGTQAGITRAKTAVTNSANTWNMNTTAVPAPTVEFSTALNGTWAATPVSATGITFVRVKPTLAESLYFLPLLNGSQYTQNIPAKAVAAQVSINKFTTGLVPYTAIAQSSTGPKFGLTPGSEYTIQWPAFNGGNNCKQNNPKGCFVKNPCSGDTDAAMWSVAKNWSSSTNGYWGFNSSSDIRASVLDGKQTAPVSVGNNLFAMPDGTNLMSSGNMASQASYLDERASSDQENSTNNVTTYMNSSTHNGRRVVVVPVVQPQNQNQTFVMGWGAFLLESNGSPSDWYKKNTNGNDGYCAVYIGPYTMGSNDAGGATSGTGGYYVTLVQ